jgi:uncharacterized Tic20 family protein
MTENVESGSGGGVGAGAEQPISRDARKWAMICHIIALVGLLGNLIGFFVGPLLVWLIKKEDDPFIDEQGKEAVNFQLTMLLAMLVGALISFLLIVCVPLVLIILAMMIIFPIIGAIKANDGEHFRYPLSFRVL